MDTNHKTFLTVGIDNIYLFITYIYWIPWWLKGKEFVCNAGDMDSIPWLGRFSGEGNGNSLQFLAWEAPMDRGAWWATVHGVTKSQTQLSD